MGSLADLHIHSTFSDGRLTPTQLVDLAYRNGVRIMALTDHDIVDGLPEAFAAAARYPDFTLIPGIEMSTDVPGNEVHILGHFIDWHDEEFRRRLVRLREVRRVMVFFQRGNRCMPCSLRQSSNSSESASSRFRAMRSRPMAASKSSRICAISRSLEVRAARMASWILASAVTFVRSA